MLVMLLMPLLLLWILILFTLFVRAAWMVLPCSISEAMAATGLVRWIVPPTPTTCSSVPVGCIPRIATSAVSEGLSAVSPASLEFHIHCPSKASWCILLNNYYVWRVLSSHFPPPCSAIACARWGSPSSATRQRWLYNQKTFSELGLVWLVIYTT